MEKKDKVISLSAIGFDSPGLISKITTKILQLNGNIIDVEENCRRGLFSIFLIIDFSASKHPVEEIKTALKGIEEGTGLKVILANCPEEEIESLSEKEGHVITILGVDQPGLIAGVSSFFHKHNVNIENCSMIARGKFFSMEMVIDTGKMIVEPSLSRNEAIGKMKSELKELCTEVNQSVVIQSEDIHKRTKKLVVFDVESTLIQETSLRDFVERIRDKVESIDRKVEFRDKDKDQLEVLIENARLVKGISLSEFERFGEILELNPGTVELIRVLKSMGFKIALLTSGFGFFIKDIFQQAGVDYAFSNTLKVDKNGITTGELQNPIITRDTKDGILEFIMDIEKLTPDQVIAVGDGSAGSHFIKNVGLSIAFKPHETSVETDGVLSGDQILGLLYCLGIPQAQLDKYSQEMS